MRSELTEASSLKVKAFVVSMTCNKNMGSPCYSRVWPRSREIRRAAWVCRLRPCPNTAREGAGRQAVKHLTGSTDLWALLPSPFEHTAPDALGREGQQNPRGGTRGQVHGRPRLHTHGEALHHLHRASVPSSTGQLTARVVRRCRCSRCGSARRRVVVQTNVPSRRGPEMHQYITDVGSLQSGQCRYRCESARGRVQRPRPADSRSQCFRVPRGPHCHRVRSTDQVSWVRESTGGTSPCQRSPLIWGL